MSEFRVKGPEIKKMLKKARKQPIAFAFSPGKSEEDSYLGMDHRKPAKMLGKDAKEQGEGNKHAFGTAVLDGKLLILTCEREMPSLAKRLKKYLGTQKVKVNVQVLDASGNLLEEDVEDLPDDPEMDADEADDETTATPAPGAAPEPAAAPGDISQVPADRPAVTRMLVERLNALRPKIEATPASFAEKLVAAQNGIVDQIRKGDIEQAETNLARLEQTLSRVAAAQNGAASAEQAASAQWKKIVGQLQSDVPAALAGGVADPARLRAVWDFAQGKAAAGDFEAALRAADALTPLMAPLAAPAAPKVSTVAFQRSRIVWLDAKRKMKSELDKLAAAIAAQTADDEDKAEIALIAEEMLAEFDQFDERLEDLLDEITSAEEGPARVALRKRAHAVIGQYLQVLDSPFFRAVDDNPFTSVAVASTARQSLGTVQKTLA